VKCINSKVIFLCDPSLCAIDQVSKHVCSGVEGSAGPRAREDERVKGIKGAGKPEKFIKRFLSWHRRTSVSDLLAPANDPACPQEDSPGVRLVERQSMVPYVGVQSSLGTPTDITLLFVRYPSRNFQARRFRVPLLSTSIQSADRPCPRLPSRGFSHSCSLSSAKD